MWSAVHTSGLKAVPASGGQLRNLVAVVSLRWKAAFAALPSAMAAFGLAIQTSRAALRPGTAAVVKMSVALESASVKPRGSVVTEG